jgi:hypothetical protein
VSAPAWERRFCGLLGGSAERALILPACTPLNLAAELEALHEAFSSGRTRCPDFQYPRPIVQIEREQTLLRAADELGSSGALGAVYAARAREIALEMRICRAAGTPALAALARERYQATDSYAAGADALAERWLESEASGDGCGSSISDDAGDPQSLVSRMRAEVGRRRLPVQVRVSDRLSALAATGAGVVYVAMGRRLSHKAVERTVLHEIEGHVLPRTRAASAPLAIFSLGTARGSDEQEGRALFLEHEAGVLDPGRRLELARRHLACRLLERGADFVETVRVLARDRGTPLADALRIAARAHRGGGLGREIVYLPSLLRVRALRQRRPALAQVLAMGLVSVEAAPLLERWAFAPATTKAADF